MDQIQMKNDIASAIKATMGKDEPPRKLTISKSTQPSTSNKFTQTDMGFNDMRKVLLSDTDKETSSNLSENVTINPPKSTKPPS